MKQDNAALREREFPEAETTVENVAHVQVVTELPPPPAANEHPTVPRTYEDRPNPLWAVNIVFVLLFFVAALFVASR